LQDFSNLKDFPILFSHFGNSARDDNGLYHEEMKQRFKNTSGKFIALLNPSIPNETAMLLFANHDIFIHAFKGSLDKSLIEATLAKIAVVSLNPEFSSQFGKWCDCGFNECSWDLKHELGALLNASSDEINKRLEKNRNIALKNHSLKKWIEKFIVETSVFLEGGV
jgi:hypothetical protein